MASNLIDRAVHPALMRIGKITIPVKREVAWGASPLKQTIIGRVQGDRLVLQHADRDQKVLVEPGPTFSLVLLNNDLRRLVVPQGMFCPAAKELLPLVNERLALAIKDFPGKGGEIGREAALAIGEEPGSGQIYGLLQFGGL